MLLPGGRILLVHSVPHWCSWLVARRWGHRRRRPDEVRAAIAAAGLRLVADRGFGAGPPRRMSHAYVIDNPTGGTTEC